MINSFSALEQWDGNEDVRYPGQRSQEDRIKHMEKGVDIPEVLWSEIRAL